MSSKTPGKDVIYIDVDDEITAIISKVRASHQKIVALVLPKRATVLQSVVNMKLLKRSSDSSKKQVVLITSEVGLLPLAGNVGLYTAKSLQTKPEIPETGKNADDDEEDEEPESEELPDEEPVDKGKTVGELAGAAAVDHEVDDDVIELGDDAEADGPATPVAGTLANKGKSKNKQFKIPNFNRFRLLIVLGAVGIGIFIAAYIVAFRILPAASISIETDSTAIQAAVPLALKTAADTQLNVDQGIALATAQTTQKTQSQQVPATGQQNNGAKAIGTASMSAGACSADVPDAIPAGTGITSAGLTFITQTSAAFAPTVSGGKCTYKTGAVDVAAQKAGAQYNVAAGTYTVVGRPTVTANGSAMAGGTDDIIKIVTQADIDGAKQKLSGQDAQPIKQDLRNGLIAKQLLPVDNTFKTNDPDVKTSANAGDQAETITVTQTVTYSMLGAKEDDLEKIVAKSVSDKIDTKKQKITDYGLDAAQFDQQSQDASGAVGTLNTTVVAGPELNTEDIKKQVAGKKASEAESIIKKNPGVTDVTVTYSPFWVSSIPTNTSKITVTIEKPKTDDNAKPSN